MFTLLPKEFPRGNNKIVLKVIPFSSPIKNGKCLKSLRLFFLLLKRVRKGWGMGQRGEETGQGTNCMNKQFAVLHFVQRKKPQINHKSFKATLI